MLELLFSFIFTLVGNLVEFILSPFINLVLSLYPDNIVYFQHIYDFFTYAFTYVATVFRWFLFTQPMFLLIFDYYAIKFAVWVVTASIRFGLKLYNVLKP